MIPNRSLLAIVLVLSPSFLPAHSPDLSSLMIYGQEGRHFIAIKSSLSAFEGEVSYLYGKGSYTTPRGFVELATEHFRKNCIIVVDGDTIGFANIRIQLGHETTAFAELKGVPAVFRYFSVKNTLFRDMPSNQCELILNPGGMPSGFPKRQVILSPENGHEARFRMVEDEWRLEKASDERGWGDKYLLGGGLVLLVSLVVVYFRGRHTR